MNIRIIVLIALAAVVLSIPAGAEMNETQGGGGGNGTYPPEWIETPTPVETATPVPEPTSVPETPPVEISAPVVEIRGEVVDAATQIAPFIWTGQNFAGLYYDVDRNLMSDSLTSTVTVPDTIESGDLAYTAYRVESCYKNPEIGEYFAIGWFGERYMAVNGKPYVLSPIIFEMDGCDKKTLVVGDEWDLGNGYFLVATRIDCNENKVWLSLFKDCVEVTSSVIQPHETGDWFGNRMSISGFPGAYTVTMWDVPTTSTFVYQEDLSLEDDVPIFSVYVNAIFCGTVTNLTQLKYAMLIDDDLINVIETGAGMMDAETVTPESVRLVNIKNIDLHRDSDIGIAGDLRIHVAADRDGDGVNNHRYYPYVNRACQTPDPDPTPTPTPPPYPADAPVEIRGEVVEPAGLQTGDIVWNASNFAAFWYDPDGDLMTETLRIASGTLSDYDRTIEEREIEFDYSEWGKYNVTSFMAETYFTGYSANTSGRITGETISLVSNGMLSKVLIDEDNKHTICTGASLELREGYGLKVLQPDVNGGNAQIELLRNGHSVDIDVAKVPATYVYTRDLGAVDDVPLIVIYIDSVFSGIETDMIVVNGIFQISEDYICDRTIEEREIEYVTETMESDFDYSGWGEYDAMSFMAETYFAGYSANTSDDITDETVSLVSNGMLSKVIVDESDKHTISTGASLELPEGYALKLIQLDASGDKAQIELLRNGKSVDTGIICNTPATYVYTRDLGKVDDVPLIAIHVNSIYSGTERDMIVINSIFQISENYISINPGDNYDEMEIVSISSDPFRVKNIRMENYNDIDLSEGETIDLMGDIKLVVADNGTLRFAPVAELTEPGTYEVRGAVHSPDVSQSAAIVWNASNFAFWYEIDSDVATETLEIAPGTLSGLDRTINEGDLMYTTTLLPQDYEYYIDEDEALGKVGGRNVTNYYRGGWMAEEYVDISTGGSTMPNADKLAKLLVEFESSSDKKTLATGEPWSLGEGFTLTAKQIDLQGNKVWMSLAKSGKEIDDSVIDSGASGDSRYMYTEDISGVEDVVVFFCWVDAIFRGTESNLVQVKYVFLIDNDVEKVEPGTTYGNMKVTTASSSQIVLKNDDDLDLSKNTDVEIMKKMFFKVADNDTVRFYPFVEHTIRGAVPAPEEPEESISDADGDGVPDVWDKEPDTPQDYWVNSDGIGRRWGDMNGDGKLTSVDAFMLLQAAAGKIGL
jgi:S-layer protein (TIGR01567 family)